MRKLIIIGAAVAALSAAVPAQAQASDAGLVVGGTAGAWTGGTIGFILGGPIGAVIGGSTGAAIGASVLSDRARFDRGYIDDPYVDIGIHYRVGDHVEDGIRLRPIRGEDRYGYFRAHGNI